MRILNLTQHAASLEQVQQGVTEPLHKDLVTGLLIFEDLPEMEDICEVAERIADIAEKEAVDYAMIGGAPFLMAPLERALISKEIVPLYAFSKRESIERTQEDGSVIKQQVFRHLGFVEAT